MSHRGEYAFAAAVAAILGLWFMLQVCGGCGSSALPTGTLLRVESKYHVGPMQQLCTRDNAEELIPIVRKAWPLVVAEHARVGIRADEKQLDGTRVCLIEQPEACGAARPCVGHVLCARRRGCASAWGRYAWVARRWPPICREEWPGEPCGAGCSCALTASEQSTDYLADLIHELAELACQSAGADAHKEPSLTAQRKALEAYRGR